MTDTAVATLLPPNSTRLEQAVALASGRVDEIPTTLRDLWDPAACPPHALPWLAWAFGVEDWEADWSEEQRRRVIDASIELKRHRGTIGAVHEAIASLGLTARVQEWFNQEPPGAPYTFLLLLEVEEIGYTQRQLARMLVMVERMKNLRAHLDRVLRSVRVRNPVRMLTVATTGHDIYVRPGARYSDDTPAIDLLIDATVNGEDATVTAIDRLHPILHRTMPAAGYW